MSAPHEPQLPPAQAPWVAGRGDKLRITAVRTFLTAPQGCPYLIGGSITGNALGGIDVARWDLKAKRFGAPLYALLGGRFRHRAAACTHVDGRDAEEFAGKVAAARERGFGHVRIQTAVPGSDTYGAAPAGAAEARARHDRSGRWDSAAYLRAVPPVLRRTRELVGDEVELPHDAHERLDPRQAGEFLRRVADAGLYFVEDVLAPEDAAHFTRLRAASPVPLAMGERFSDPTRFPPLPAGPVIDFARTRIPTLGGLTPARNSPPPANCAASGSPRTGRATSAHSRRRPPSPSTPPAPPSASRRRRPSARRFWRSSPGRSCRAWGRWSPGRPRGWASTSTRAPRAGIPPEPLAHDRWALLRTTDGSVPRP